MITICNDDAIIIYNNIIHIYISRWTGIFKKVSQKIQKDLKAKVFKVQKKKSKSTSGGNCQGTKSAPPRKSLEPECQWTCVK